MFFETNLLTISSYSIYNSKLQFIKIKCKGFRKEPHTPTSVWMPLTSKLQIAFIMFQNLWFADLKVETTIAIKLHKFMNSIENQSQ